MRRPSPDEPFSALAFKIMTDPYVGKLTYFRVYSGQLDAGSYVYNSSSGKRERIGRLLLMMANDREDIKHVEAGDIVAAVGLKDTRTGHTLCDEGKPIIKRVLGKTGIELPVVSMGVMRSDNKVLVRAALKEGRIHLDTAHGYQKGKNETMLGEVLESYPRDSFVIATKVPAMSKSSFLEKLDISLERLKMKYVDILYVHGLSSRDDVLGEETLETLADVRKSGKVRHVGQSTHKNETETILAAVESGVYEVVLTAYNFKQYHLEELKKNKKFMF